MYSLKKMKASKDSTFSNLLSSICILIWYFLRPKPKPACNNGKTLLDFNRDRSLEVVVRGNKR